MAFYHSHFHHSNHPNFKQPYGNRPHRSPRFSEQSDQALGGDQASIPVGYSSSSAGVSGSYAGGVTMGVQRYQNGAMSSGCTLWMGNIDETMDENFVRFAFNNLGVNIQNVKIIRNKDTGLPVGYGFVTFDDRNTAQSVLRELNGQKIPNIDDDKRFFLKPANRQAGGPPQQQQQRMSIFVGNLAPEIDDDILMQAFFTYYPSVSSAKVITNEGQSKGFGFVTFEDEYDYQVALSNPNMMLGESPITISRARHSTPGARNSRVQSQDSMSTRPRRTY
ncbi:tRNA selenocysteine 1-associated protein 1 [Blomia tropicalis]|nr:tRNA selenocysteine 1-associated protein 1 [Blomia tropicalis]